MTTPQLFFSLHNDKIGIIAYGKRLGVRAFIVFVEHNIFPPHDPELNAKLQIGVTHWAGLEWIVLIFPEEFKEQVQKQAADLGLRFFQGYPAAFTHKGREEFPIQVPNLHVIRGQAIYEGDFEAGKSADDAEREAVLKFLADYDEKHPLPPAE